MVISLKMLMAGASVQPWKAIAHSDTLSHRGGKYEYNYVLIVFILLKHNKFSGICTIVFMYITSFLMCLVLMSCVSYSSFLFDRSNIMAIFWLTLDQNLHFYTL